MGAQEDLGRAVLDGAGVNRELLVGRAELLREAEVSDADVPAPAHEQVVRLQVLPNTPSTRWKT